MAKKYTPGLEPLEKALEEGRGKLYAEEAVGLRGRIRNKEQKKPKNRKGRSLAKFLVRKFRELRGGSQTYLHETPSERHKRVEMEKE